MTMAKAKKEGADIMVRTGTDLKEKFFEEGIRQKEERKTAGDAARQGQYKIVHNMQCAQCRQDQK